ncbi:conserved transmembrane protein [Mycobacterium tuberculosis EAS054]|nr:conserved transmembrane protein [Mycobacterium tuberculosis EAS054]
MGVVLAISPAGCLPESSAPRWPSRRSLFSTNTVQVLLGGKSFADVADVSFDHLTEV